MDFPNLQRSLSRWRDIPIPEGTQVSFLVGHEADGWKPRHFGCAGLKTRNHCVVTLSPDLEYLPSPKRDGVILHEIGHALCFLRGYDDHSERDADAAAEHAFNLYIYYDPEDLVQTTTRGIRPRPARLT